MCGLASSPSSILSHAGCREENWKDVAIHSTTTAEDIHKEVIKPPCVLRPFPSSPILIFILSSSQLATEAAAYEMVRSELDNKVVDLTTDLDNKIAAIRSAAFY